MNTHRMSIKEKNITSLWVIKFYLVCMKDLRNTKTGIFMMLQER